MNKTEYDKQRYARLKDKILLHCKEYYIKNKVKIKNGNNKWASKNREYLRRQSKKYYLKTKDKKREYQTKNKEHINENHRERYSKKKIAINIFARNYYKENKSHILQQRAELKYKVFKHYGNKCKCCGESNVLFFTIDHINNDGHLFRKENKHTGSSIYSWITKNNYPKYLQLLCYNCNLGKARNKGICPHKEII